jgi:hypothetical protein
LVLAGVAAAPAMGQETGPSLPARTIVLPPFELAPLPAEHARELAQWTHDYQAWRTWFARWRNQVEPGLFSARKRRAPPAPPAWLPPACSNLLEDEGPLFDACAAWRDWSHYDLATDLLVQQKAQTQKVLEAPDRTLWWERVHVDALWPMTRTGTGAFGIAGVHTTVHVTKRFQVFLTPGAILMRLPGIDGTETWGTATDWGFSVSLFDFRMPGLRRATTAHLNLARIWLLGSSSIQMPGDLYVAGFSFSFKKR